MAVIYILLITNLIIQFVFMFRIYLGLIDVYNVKKRWLLLFVFCEALAMLIFGYSPSFVPKKIVSRKNKAAPAESDFVAQAMDSGLTVNIKHRSVRDFLRRKKLLKDIHLNISKDTTVAMTIMPFLLIVELVFSGALFTLPEGTGFLTDITISKWSLTALCVQGDYNSQPIVTTRNTAVSMKNLEIEGEKPLYDLLVYIEKNDLRDEVLKKSGELSAKPEYSFEIMNVIKCWLWLIFWTAIYALASVIVLEFIDNDKR